MIITKEPQSKRIDLRINESLFNAILKQSKDTKIKTSELIRDLLEKSIEKH